MFGRAAQTALLEDRMTEFKADELVRYTRNLAISEIGRAGQEKLKAARVMVIGCGGLGSPAALYLAAAGVGTVGLTDNDEVELSNLQRQIAHSTATLGRSKVDSARELLIRLNPEITVETCRMRVSADNLPGLVRDYDFVLDCTDSFDSKYIVSDGCVRAGKPFTHAAVVRFGGQIMTVIPGVTPCLRCVFPDKPAPDSLPSPAQLGVLGAACGVLGSLEALEALKYILGVGENLRGTLLTFDGLALNFRKRPLPRRSPQCPACGGMTG